MLCVAGQAQTPSRALTGFGAVPGCRLPARTEVCEQAQQALCRRRSEHLCVQPWHGIGGRGPHKVVQRPRCSACRPWTGGRPRPQCGLPRASRMARDSSWTLPQVCWALQPRFWHTQTAQVHVLSRILHSQVGTTRQTTGTRTWTCSGVRHRPGCSWTTAF